MESKGEMARHLRWVRGRAGDRAVRQWTGGSLQSRFPLERCRTQDMADRIGRTHRLGLSGGGSPVALYAGRFPAY